MRSAAVASRSGAGLGGPLHCAELQHGGIEIELLDHDTESPQASQQILVRPPLDLIRQAPTG